MFFFLITLEKKVNNLVGVTFIILTGSTWDLQPTPSCSEWRPVPSSGRPAVDIMMIRTKFNCNIQIMNNHIIKSTSNIAIVCSMIT